MREAEARVVLHRAPSAGFDDPFEMLHACHERVERMLVLLQRLDAHLKAQGADAQAAGAARDVMRYFDQAGPAHHEDEERHVLPALRQIGQTGLADRLHAEHLDMARLWKPLREALLEVVAGRAPVAPRTLPWQPFAAQYRRHIGDEESQAYPVLVRTLDAAAVATIGADMAARRGLPTKR